MTSLLEFCSSDRQRQVCQEWEKCGSMYKAAQVLKMNRGDISKMISRLKKRAVKQGWSPEHDFTHKIPEPQKLRGVSTLYKNGEILLQWVKTKEDEAALEALMRETVASMAKEITPCAPEKYEGGLADKDKMNFLTLTDLHLGMLAWRKEGGADWDLKIAEQTVDKVVADLLSRADNAETGFLCQLGDLLHMDGLVPETPNSGHVLDADSRFHKVADTAVTLMRRVVRMMLKKHKKVIVLMAEGNHDESSSVWLQVMFRQLYERDKRVEVVFSPLPYYAYQFGDCLLGAHHGHKAKDDKLPLLFSAEFRKMYGNTRQTYIHTGHNHTTEVFEVPGAIVHKHPTIAARDAYASRNGYHSLRQMNLVTYHKKDLEIGGANHVIKN